MNSDQVLEFTTPFDLESCRQRLDNRHERPKLFAWDWQHRTYVHTRQTAPDTVQFTLKRLEKNEWVSWGSLSVVRGTMRALGNGQTVVIAHPQIADFWVFSPLMVTLMALVQMCLAALNDPHASAENIMLMVGPFALFSIGLTLLLWWWAHAQLRHLIGTLKESLGQYE